MRTLYTLFATILISNAPLDAQSQALYVGSNVTGQLSLSSTVNLMSLARQPQVFGTAMVTSATDPFRAIPLLRPPARYGTLMLAAPAIAQVQSLAVSPASNAVGFVGLSHLDQRLANGGNQFSVEPPNPSVAVSNGYILEGVNNAIQVYNVSGIPLLPNVLTSNQVFNLPPAIIRSTGVNGPFPTDMRVFYDQGIDRWFILQRAQDYDVAGNPLNHSHLYLAVSQTGDPTAGYNNYIMDTTDAQNGMCPCFLDYPQIGADQYGFYISANEYNTYYSSFVRTTILAISKSSLASGASSPTVVRFVMPMSSGYEFAIQPASTPPGGSYFLASGGGEFFVSAATSAFDNHLALWAMYNTASLGTLAPNPTLIQTLVSTLGYLSPDVATQRSGSLPYGSSLFPPGTLAFLDGGDSRIQSLSYAGGRLYASLATQVTDDKGRSVVGGAYVILSPTFRGGVLTSPVLRQGYLMVNGNHLLRPAIAVNPQGRGAIAVTLAGPDYYPSAAFLPIDTMSTGTTIQISAAGAAPEDGFSGYGTPGMQGVARWGDYATAVAGPDGGIWMTTEYISNQSRTQLANWSTFLTKYVP